MKSFAETHPIVETPVRKSRARKKVATPPPPPPSPPPPPEEKKAIFQWTMQGSKEVAGRVPQYNTLLYNDGTTSCDCMGWIYFRPKKDERGQVLPGQERGCKHTKLIAEDAAEYLKKYQKGEELPRFDVPEGSTGSLVVDTQKKPVNTTGLRYGRVVTLD
jgi:hypothetical protein